MENGSVALYVASFLARCEAVRHPAQPEVDEPGVHGLVPTTDKPLARLLVTDDRAQDLVRRVLPNAHQGMINVFAAAANCAQLVSDCPAWRGETATAMVCADLRTVPTRALSDELSLRAVRRLADDPPDGVPLEDAVTAAKLADPRIETPPSEFAEYLRSLPSAVRLLAAVDADGVVRATSGYGTYGAAASVMFVNTDPGWRRQGIGEAMTAAALHAAHELGALHACLDATGSGQSIYSRLGFGAVTQTTRFSPRPEPHPA